MMTSFSRGALTARLAGIAFSACSVISAYPANGAELVPAFSAAVPFGASGQAPSLQLRSGFNVVSRNIEFDRPLFIPYAELSLTSGGIVRQSVLGHALNETGEAPSHNWIWWTVGGLAAAGAAVSALGGSHHEGSDTTSRHQNGTVCGNNDVVLGNNCLGPPAP